MSTNYSTKHSKILNQDIYQVLDSDGTVLISLTNPEDPEDLVSHLNEPVKGKYRIEDISDDDGPYFELLDPAGDTVTEDASREALEGLLSHLHRHH